MADTVQSLARELAQERYDFEYQMALEGGCISSFTSITVDSYMDDALEFIRRCRAATDDSSNSTQPSNNTT